MRWVAVSVAPRPRGCLRPSFSEGRPGRVQGGLRPGDLGALLPLLSAASIASVKASSRERRSWLEMVRRARTTRVSSETRDARSSRSGSWCWGSSGRCTACGGKRLSEAPQGGGAKKSAAAYLPVCVSGEGEFFRAII